MGGLRTGIRPGYIAATSKMVTDCSGMVIQPHKVCPEGQSDTCTRTRDKLSLLVSTSGGATCLALRLAPRVTAVTHIAQPRAHRSTGVPHIVLQIITLQRDPSRLGSLMLLTQGDPTLHALLGADGIAFKAANPLEDPFWLFLCTVDVSAGVGTRACQGCHGWAGPQLL